MDVLKTVLVSFGSFFTLFLLTKLMGNKQMSELNMFDYIIGITIGSIAAEMATSLESDFLLPLTAMVVYALLSLLLSVLGNKSIKLRRFFVGKSLLLFDRGTFFRKNLSKARIDINEFLTQCRVMGYYSICDIETALLEPNGKISVLPKSEKRPCNPGDLGLTVSTQRPETVIISDGNVLSGNLKSIGRDERWLDAQLKEHKLTRDRVFLAVSDTGERLTAFAKNSDKPDRDVFQ